MAYPEGLLAADEHVVIHKHPHWKMLVVPVLAFLLLVALCSYLAALVCLLYTSPSPRDRTRSRMPSSA